MRQTMTLQKLYLRRYWQSIPRRTKHSAGNYLLSRKVHDPLANANESWTLRHMKQSRLMLAIERARGKAQLSSARRRSWKNKPAGVLDESARWHVRRTRSQACQAAWSKARQTNLAVASASGSPPAGASDKPGCRRVRRAWPSASCRIGQRHPPRTAWGRRCSTSAREPRHSP